MNKDNKSGHDNKVGINAKQRTTSNKGMLKERERVFLKEEHANCLSKTKWSVLKNIHKSNIIYREVTLMYLRICACVC